MNLDIKNCFLNSIILTVSKYYIFYGEIIPWQPQMHGLALYNKEQYFPASPFEGLNNDEVMICLWAHYGEMLVLIYKKDK